MTSSNPSQLFLLADHIKLSLLERQRAVSLNLSPNSQDGQISRSLDSLKAGLDAIETHLAESEDSDLRDQLFRLQTQYRDLSAQFETGDGSDKALTTPNDPSLQSDFSAAQRASKSPVPQSGRNATLSKSVRFTDNPEDEDRNALFPYRDDPDDESPDQSHLNNQQIHQYHSQVLREQDTQLDALGESIGRQRDLSIQIGDELDNQALLLDDVDERTDRHQSQLDRAKTRVNKIGRAARDNWSMTIIILLIVILILLIVILK
ncbi:SNARE complex subunit [Eremomyces bilateralis CBS 781.70]|uniref:SNARE complex subunit n=1 Tax=Eremomyces bilateralis CBS 781.70 TaxID=1392243 RepID=A0A6G1G8F7_9PEZI|nr:SNARE complex subunit [Eremomyces bilateralis CBS 781.70]KAF1814313.1 SNARE complex subunit [Eremomyces bilateralis CBS 781.70]